MDGQHAGIDIHFDRGNKHYLVDEKAYLIKFTH